MPAFLLIDIHDRPSIELLTLARQNVLLCAFACCRPAFCALGHFC